MVILVILVIWVILVICKMTRGMRMGYLLQFQNQDLSHLRPGPARAPKAAKRGWVIAQIAFIGS